MYILKGCFALSEILADFSANLQPAVAALGARDIDTFVYILLSSAMHAGQVTWERYQRRRELFKRFIIPDR